jgi:hypothetical protein
MCIDEVFDVCVLGSLQQVGWFDPFITENIASLCLLYLQPGL